ncbi:MAG TPA: amino acid permease, partial [Methanothrix sp.]|nr:amino acid permease [Methanothrix sp.]
IAFTIVEALGLVIVIMLGLPHLGSVDYLEMPQGLGGIFQAAALIFFAFIGFEEMVKLSEEAKDPERTIPLGLILAVTICIVLYIAVAVSAVSVLGWQRLSESPAPFGDIAFAALGERAFVVVSVIALFSTSNTVLLMLLAASRIMYGMAGSGSLPGFLAQVHPVTKTPWAAILLAMILSMAFSVLRDIALVADINNFTVFLTFIVINAALVVLRYKNPDASRPFRVPISFGRLPLLPLLGIAFNAFMLLQLSSEVLAIGAGLAILGTLAAFLAGRYPR